MRTLLIILLLTVGAHAQVTTSTLALTTDTPPEQVSIESVSLVDGQLEIISRVVIPPGNFVPAVICDPMPCDFTQRFMRKEIYGIRDGKVALLRTIKGRIIKEVVKESVEWEGAAHKAATLEDTDMPLTLSTTALRADTLTPDTLPADHVLVLTDVTKGKTLKRKGRKK